MRGKIMGFWNLLFGRKKDDAQQLTSSWFLTEWDGEISTPMAEHNYLKNCSGEQAEIAVDHVMAVLESTDSSTEYWKLCRCFYALEMLGAHAHRAVDTLKSAKYLKDSRDPIRRSVLRVFCEVGARAKTALPEITEALNDEDRTGCKFHPSQNSRRLMRVKAISLNPR
jgi:hypothetical protein